MIIDWFTVGAQVLNFLILVWLMKRFLYQPILHAIDEREKRIAAELGDADTKRAQAENERNEFQKKNAAFEKQRAELLNQATFDAKTEGQRLLDEARKAADSLSAKRQETLRNEVHHLNQTIRRRTQLEVFAIARQALSDLATASLEDRLCEVFTRRLREMDAKTKEGLAEALITAIEPSLVRSAFDLSAEQRASIQHALNETFSVDPAAQLRTGIQIRFETAPELISGIELVTETGQKLAWSIADYLLSLEKGVAELLKDQDKPLVKVMSELEANNQ